MSRNEKIELATEILGPLQPYSYCRQVPEIDDVVAGRSGRVTLAREEWEGTFEPDERGNVVMFDFVCRGAENRFHAAGEVVVLNDREVLHLYNDPTGTSELDR